MATRRRVEIKPGNAGEARRTTPEDAAVALAITAEKPRIAPETLQARQDRVRKTRRPAGPRRQTRTLGVTAEDVPVPDVEPTDVEEVEEELNSNQ